MHGEVAVADKAGERLARRRVPGELALAFAVFINTFAVVLMLHSGSGISAVSSVPYAFSEVAPWLTLGTWTYLFQGTLILSLMVMRRRFVGSYLFSFVVGFAFGVLIDVHKAWVFALPQTLPLQVLYFVASYLIISLGIAISNRCGLPITPTDLFPRELVQIVRGEYGRIKIIFDVTCLAVTAGLTLLFLGRVEGLGVGTVLAAFTMGKAVAAMGRWLDENFDLSPAWIGIRRDR